MRHSNAESGHYKNVASFHALLQLCEALGEQYRPSREDLSLAVLRGRAAEADGLMERLSKAEAALAAAVHARMVAFAALRKFSTRVINALEQSNPSSPAIGGARHLVAKLHGKRIGKIAPTPEGAESPVRISASQAGYDAQLDHFIHLVHYLEQEPAYKPNEPEMSLEGLKELVAQLSRHNLLAAELKAQRQLLIGERKQLLYGAVKGLLPLSVAIKKYFIMVFGTESRELKAAQALSFRAERK